MASKIVTFTLNGHETEVLVKPLTTLAKALREKLGFTATKCGCYEGNCGSCTVIVNGEPVLSCILPIEEVEGQSVLTLEGITPPEGLHPLQQAFHENFAVQCGFCTPGMLMIGKALLDKNPHPTQAEIAEALSGNLCRCTGYDPIIAAVQQVAAGTNVTKEVHMSEQSLNVVGQSVLRRDGLSHVTGKTLYIDDIQFPDMLYLKMVRSPLHHGRIQGIDFSEAEKVPGFVRAFTYKDVPKNIYTILCLIGVGPDEEPVLAEKEVLFKGEQIAAIVAQSEEAAIEAAARVKLDLEELPAVFDVEEALKPGAPILKPWGTNYFVYEGHHCRRVRFGNIEEGFAKADFIVEGCYEPKPIEHAPLETTGCVAKPEANGRITVYTNTQALYFSMDNTALILQVPFNKLHFVGGTVGGAFGGKVDVIVEPIAALAAMHTGHPVKYLYTREEEFHVSSTRVAYRIYFKDGVTKDGRIVARQVTSYADSGAYNRHTPYAATKHAANISGPYAIPNVHIDVHCVYTNRVPTSAMRGFGVTSASFATELQMDKIARTVGMDPYEIRLLNAYRNGDMRPYQKVVGDATLVEVIKRAAEMVHHPLGERFQAMTSWDRSNSPAQPEPVSAEKRS